MTYKTIAQNGGRALIMAITNPDHETFDSIHDLVSETEKWITFFVYSSYFNRAEPWDGCPMNNCERIAKLKKELTQEFNMQKS